MLTKKDLGLKFKEEKERLKEFGMAQLNSVNKLADLKKELDEKKGDKDYNIDEKLYEFFILSSTLDGYKSFAFMTMVTKMRDLYELAPEECLEHLEDHEKEVFLKDLEDRSHKSDLYLVKDGIIVYNTKYEAGDFDKNRKDFFDKNVKERLKDTILNMKVDGNSETGSKD